MSAEEIIAELPKLTPEELRQVKVRTEELTANAGKSVWDVFREFAGTAKGLPADFAHHHDHYLYGIPKKET